jgi:protein O-GlcNAc transferase
MVPAAEHLARYQHVDLFLDTAPVCGHTTASDALWCGVPVVTLADDTFISRVAASLLSAVELPELAVATLAEYETLALELATNGAKRTQIREHLETGRMQFSLFDSAATTRALEAAYLHAANLHRAGKKPVSFSLTDDFSASNENE